MTNEYRIRVNFGSHRSVVWWNPAEVLEYIQSHRYDNSWVFADGQRVDPNQVDEANLSTVSSVHIVPGLIGCDGPCKILVIGAGGIGSSLIEHISRAMIHSDEWAEHLPKEARGAPLYSKCCKGLRPITIRVMDGDTVEERNLSHQKFALDDVGKPKVEVLSKRLRDMGISGGFRNVTLEPLAEDFTVETNISGYELVIVAVDREEPRRLVHEKAKAWLDLRCRGDGFLMWSHLDDIQVLNMFQPLPDGESASCQLEGAVETGNIQFGFALAAAHGAQWIIQWLRNSLVPPSRTYTIHMGDLPLPQIIEVNEE